VAALIQRLQNTSTLLRFNHSTEGGAICPLFVGGSMRHLKPSGKIKIDKQYHDIVFTLDIIDELQDKVKMPMSEIIELATEKKTMKLAVQCLLKYLLKQEIEIKDDKVEYYSLVLINAYIEQIKSKEIEIKEKPRVIESEEPQWINIEYWFYIGKVVLGYPEEEVWNMTLGKLITLRNEHALYTGVITEDKEVSVDEAIPL